MHSSQQKIFIVGGIVLSFFLILMAFFISRERTSFFGRAASNSSRPESSLSLENSYVFASPISAAADGSSVIRVTVFLLNSQGLGVAGQTVKLASNNPLSISQAQTVSDSLGKFTFDVIASNPGDYTITASVEGVSLPQKVSISFR